MTNFSIFEGFLVDKFGKYKPVLLCTLLLNALFHHALFIIPQQEIPGVMPASYVMRHPRTGNVEVSKMITTYLKLYKSLRYGGARALAENARRMKRLTSLLTLALITVSCSSKIRRLKS